eukprot:342306-Amphidinium_carterae.1
MLLFRAFPEGRSIVNFMTQTKEILRRVISATGDLVVDAAAIGATPPGQHALLGAHEAAKRAQGGVLAGFTVNSEVLTNSSVRQSASIMLGWAMPIAVSACGALRNSSREMTPSWLRSSRSNKPPPPCLPNVQHIKPTFPTTLSNLKQCII